MKKFIDTVSIEKLLDVPFPRRGNYKFMIVDVEAYIQEVKHDFALEKATFILFGLYKNSAISNI